MFQQRNPATGETGDSFAELDAAHGLPTSDERELRIRRAEALVPLSQHRVRPKGFEPLTF